jgi:hypothetical protein
MRAPARAPGESTVTVLFSARSLKFRENQQLPSPLLSSAGISHPDQFCRAGGHWISRIYLVSTRKLFG